MALRWLPFDDRILEGMLVLASSSWTSDSLAATWPRTGWSVPALVTPYDAAWLGDWGILTDGREPPRIDCFFTRFVFFLHQNDGPEEHGHDQIAAERERHEFLEGTTPADARTSFTEHGLDQPGFDTRWGDPAAGRAEFDAAWRHACARITRRLGQPAYRGQHCSDQWAAVWPVADRVLLLCQQGSDWQTTLCGDEVALSVTERDPGDLALTGTDICRYTGMC